MGFGIMELLFSLIVLGLGYAVLHLASKSDASIQSLGKIIGPSIAGILIGIYGVGWCLFINGLSFVAIVISLFMMSPPDTPKKAVSKHGIFGDLVDAFLYFSDNKTILLLMISSFSRVPLHQALHQGVGREVDEQNGDHEDGRGAVSVGHR